MNKIPNTELSPSSHNPIDSLDTEEAIDIMLASHLSGVKSIKNNLTKIIKILFIILIFFIFF